MNKITILSTFFIFLFSACAPQTSTDIEPLPAELNSQSDQEPIVAENLDDHTPQLFTSEDGNFKISYPETSIQEVEEFTETVVLRSGRRAELPSVTFKGEGDHVEFLVMYGEMPGFLISPDSLIIHSAFDSMLPNMDLLIPNFRASYLKNDLLIDLDGYQGKQQNFEFSRQGETLQLETRTYLIHDRFYLLVAQTPAEETYQDVSKSFLSSFEILAYPDSVVLEEWQPFSPDAGDFAVNLPTVPRVFEQGQVGVDRMYMVADGDVYLNIFVNAFNKDAVPKTQSEFEQFIETRFGRFSSDASSESRFLDEPNLFGWEMTYKPDPKPNQNDLEELETIRIYVANGNMYGASITMPTDSFDLSKAETFFDGLEIKPDLGVLETGPSNSDADQNDSNWETFESEEGLFQISFPESPEVNVVDQPSSSGNIQTVYHSVYDDGELYRSTYVQLPYDVLNNLIGSPEAFESVMTHLIQSYQAELLDFSPVNFQDEYKGLLFTAVIPESAKPNGGVL